MHYVPFPVHSCIFRIPHTHTHTVLVLSSSATPSRDVVIMCSTQRLSGRRRDSSVRPSCDRWTRRMISCIRRTEAEEHVLHPLLAPNLHRWRRFHITTTTIDLASGTEVGLDTLHEEFSKGIMAHNHLMAANEQCQAIQVLTRMIQAIQHLARTTA